MISPIYYIKAPHKLMLGNEYLRADIGKRFRQKVAIRALMVDYLQKHYRAKFRIKPGESRHPIFVLRPESPFRLKDKVSINYTLTYKGKEPDHENLAFAFKPVQDMLVEMGIIKDDSPQYIEIPIYETVKIKRNDDYWFSIEVMGG